MVNKTRRATPSTWLRLAGTLLTLALLVYLLREQGWEEISDALLQISWWRFLAALGLMMISRLAVTGRWHVLLRAAKLQITFYQTARITFAGLFASNFLPTTIGGDVIRLAGAIQLKYDAAVSAASLVADRLIGMAGMALALPFGLRPFLESGILSSLQHESQLSAAPAALLSAQAWAGKLWAKGMRALKKILQALSAWAGQPQALLSALALSWVHMLCLFASMYLLLAAMNEPISFWLLAGLWSIVYFVTLLPVSINGYGLQELSITIMFTQVGGISQSGALTIALLVRTLTMLASLPGAVFVPGIMAARATNEPVQKQV